jgi:TRAP-type uncharacterized transport system fused permease subunit
MIWFDIKNLENKIINNELSDKDGFNYVLAFFILSVIVLSFITNDSSAWFKLTECIIAILINIWGLKTVYEVNNEIDGKDFLKRFFAINWVIGMRLIVISIILAVIAGIVIGIFSVTNGMIINDTNPDKDILGLIFTAIFSIICYLLMINSFHRLRKKVYRT